jgi:mRNA interferase HigB
LRLDEISIKISVAIISKKWKQAFHFWEILSKIYLMIVIGTDLVEAFFEARAGHRGIKAARAQYESWRAIAESSHWKTPEDVKKSHPKASILKGGRVVFNIKANDYRLITVIQYSNGVLMIRFFGSHEEYDRVNAETV